jgi:hypothetical protein
MSPPSASASGDSASSSSGAYPHSRGRDADDHDIQDRAGQQLLDAPTQDYELYGQDDAKIRLRVRGGESYLPEVPVSQEIITMRICRIKLDTALVRLAIDSPADLDDEPPGNFLSKGVR